MSKATAKCDFLHQGINYKKGRSVELDGEQLNALSNAGLVEWAKEPESKKAAEPVKDAKTGPVSSERVTAEKEPSPSKVDANAAKK